MTVKTEARLFSGTRSSADRPEARARSRTTVSDWSVLRPTDSCCQRINCMDRTCKARETRARKVPYFTSPISIHQIFCYSRERVVRRDQRKKYIKRDRGVTTRNPILSFYGPDRFSKRKRTKESFENPQLMQKIITQSLQDLKNLSCPYEAAKIVGVYNAVLYILRFLVGVQEGGAH